MSRYTDVRAGFHRSTSSAQAKPRQPESRSRVSEEDREEQRELVMRFFRAGNPFYADSCKRRDALYAEFGGKSLDIAIAAIEVVLEKGAASLRRDAAVPPAPDAAVSAANRGESETRHPGQDAHVTKPLYTPATLVRAAGELRKLMDKREALIERAMTLVAEQWAMAHAQMADHLTRQDIPEGELTPEEALAAMQSFAMQPDAHAPPVKPTAATAGSAM